MITYNVIGLMSGTSLDGTDIAFCTFTRDKGKWSFRLLKAVTIPYSAEWRERLLNAHNLNAFDFHRTHVEYGHLLGKLVHEFIQGLAVRPDFVASHGHTVFHRPELGVTCQIGDGASISAETGLPTINDFRSLDVALGGQGAPLVPIGDALLFGEYEYCLNLGGIANISFRKSQERVAFDICPVNQVLNKLANQLGLEYDTDGMYSSKGKTDESLLEKLNSLEFYRLPYPKSLGREWVEKHFWPIIEESPLSTEDKLRTVTEHIALIIGKAIGQKPEQRLLITGGGAFNRFLIGRIRGLTAAKAELPSEAVISFKEAIIFGLLGVLRFEKTANCLKSVTGARIDSCGGAVYHP